MANGFQFTQGEACHHLSASILASPSHHGSCIFQGVCLLSRINFSAESLILTSDFNFHMDVADDPEARFFLDLLTSMRPKQHVTVSIHISGHTLDLVITREYDPIIASAPVADRYLSDHSSVLCSLNTTSPNHETKEICYR